MAPTKTKTAQKRKNNFVGAAHLCEGICRCPSTADSAKAASARAEAAAAAAVAAGPEPGSLAAPLLRAMSLRHRRPSRVADGVAVEYQSSGRVDHLRWGRRQ